MDAPEMLVVSVVRSEESVDVDNEDSTLILKDGMTSWSEKEEVVRGSA
jgi:hypothetical protein